MAVGVALVGAAALAGTTMHGGGRTVTSTDAHPTVELRGALADSTQPYPTPVCSSGTCVVTYTPVEGGQTFTVPTTGSIQATLLGGTGGGSGTSTGGNGAEVTATLSEPAGQVLGIDAGGLGTPVVNGTVSTSGANDGGINGGGTGGFGGGGGGRSDVMLGSTPLLVAGGGGGAGDGSQNADKADGYAGCWSNGDGPGGYGGYAGADDGTAGAQGTSLDGPDGGGFDLNGGDGGQGGTETSAGPGGAGGSVYITPYNGTVNAYNCGELTSQAGNAGAAGSGSQGGSATVQAGTGGGGGGGYYGGGAGGGAAVEHDTQEGSDITFASGYGGGGAGSSYVATRIDVIHGTVNAGQNGNGNGSVVITYAQPTGSTPSAPGDVTATPSTSSADGADDVPSATVSFSPPTDDGGQPIEHYTVTVTEASDPSYRVVAYGGTSPITIPFVYPGPLYTFSVTATNAAGYTGPPASTMALLTPGGLDAPTDVQATADPGQTSTGTATVTFTAAVAYPAVVTGYTVTATDETTADNGGQTATGGTSSAGTGPGAGIEVGGLVNGDQYTFTVTASNGTATATSSPSNAITTTGPPTPPGAPTDVTASIYGQIVGSSTPTVIVTWTAPTSPGTYPVRDYTVRATDLSHSGLVVPPVDAGDAEYAFFSSLQAGDTYDFTVTAANGAGTSPPFTSGPASAPSAPLAVVSSGQQPSTPPVDLTAYPEDGAVGLVWAAPVADNGSPVTGYDVYVSSVTGSFEQVDTTPITTTSYTVNGLQDGRSYRFYVVAENAGGFSNPSATVSAVPAAPPGPPSDVTAIPGPGQVTVTWTPPTSDGGSPVIGYNVYAGTSPGAEAGQPVNGYELPATATSYTVTGLTPGRTYYFTVQAYNDAGESQQSSEVSATPAAAAGGNPTPPASVPESALPAEAPVAAAILIAAGVALNRRRRRSRRP